MDKKIEINGVGYKDYVPDLPSSQLTRSPTKARAKWLWEDFAGFSVYFKT